MQNTKQTDNTILKGIQGPCTQLLQKVCKGRNLIVCPLQKCKIDYRKGFKPSQARPEAKVFACRVISTSKHLLSLSG
eukprot:c6585_g1_i1 orf=903-1133(+)